jgi:RsiW-degrading membrane proteinase PrsW (M82 family)
MSTGATISTVTLLSTAEASGVCFIRCCIWSGWGSLSTLIPSVWSLKKNGVQNHLLLRGNKSLASWSRHRLRARWNGVEEWSSR